MKKVLLLILALGICLSAESFAKTMKEAKFSANMTCATCKGKIEKALKAEKGVESVTADVKTKLVTVKYDADVANEAGLKSTVAKLGYAVDAKNAKEACTDKKECKDKKDAGCTDKKEAGCKDSKKCSGKCGDKTK